MADKLHHDRQPAPHGCMPNWALACVMACAIAVAGLAHTLIL